MEPLAASSSYVAVKRAEQSVAIVLDNSGAATLPYWTRSHNRACERCAATSGYDFFAAAAGLLLGGTLSFFAFAVVT
jgi:hypothetical protein